MNRVKNKSIKTKKGCTQSRAHPFFVLIDLFFYCIHLAN